MPDPKRFSFSTAAGASREVGSLPFLPFTLQHGDSIPLQVEGLLDTGATVSVLPYRVGLQLGAIWSDRAPAVQLTGTLAQFEAQALLLTALGGGVSPCAPRLRVDPSRLGSDSVRPQ